VDTQKIYASNKRFEVIGAIVTGLCLGYIISRIRNSDGIYVYDSVRCLILAVGSYLISAILVHTSKLRKSKVPKWIFIAIVGTVICHLTIILIPNEIDFWKFREEASTFNYVAARLPKTIFYFLAFSVIYIPVSLVTLGTTCYLGIALRGLKR
jgi:hypothetical protein